MVPLCILFAHHRNDAVTRHHLEILRENNSDPIIPICHSPCDPVAGAVDVSRFSKRFAADHPWMRGDAMLYLWFRHSRTVEAERYAYIEWDTLATMPLPEYYQEVWNADAAGSHIKTPQTTPEWEWFRLHGPRLPDRLKPSAVGIAPLNAVLLSRRALKSVCDSQIPKNVFSELRLGSLLRFNGVTPIAFVEAKASTNDWQRGSAEITKSSGVFHPVKVPHVSLPYGSK